MDMEMIQRLEALLAQVKPNSSLKKQGSPGHKLGPDIKN